MIKLFHSKFGTMVSGCIKKIKYGKGDASETLTILTLVDVSFAGTPQPGKLKVLCWNSSFANGSKLSDKVRKYEIGDFVTCRTTIDIGNPNICTAREIKKAGMYSLLAENDARKYMICGKVSKIADHGQLLCFYVPVTLYRDNKKETIWYRAVIDKKNEAALKIQTNDYCVFFGDNVIDKRWGVAVWKEMSTHNFKSMRVPNY